MQFVTVDEHGKYTINSRAHDLLAGLQAPLTVVSVIGRYRTGKSSLLNGLVGAPTFETSSSVQAQTKGILIHVLDERTILLDTEGLGSMDVTRDHDASIFALAMLVSSGCFFNNLGGITSQAVDDLHLSTKVASLLCKHNRFNKQLPELVWVMRDFTLDLCDANGIPISGDVYFEQCIDKCEPSKANDLRTLFPSRQCVPLTRPTVDEEDLRTMQNLRPEFTQGVENIRNMIRRFPPKAIGNVPVNGSQLFTLATAVCTSLNANVVPDLDDVWKLVEAKARETALHQATTEFKSAPSTLRGLEQAYATYTNGILDDGVSGEDCFRLLYDLIQHDVRGAEFEDMYLQTKRDFDIFVATSGTEQKELEARVADRESDVSAAYRKVAQLVEDGLSLKHRIAELETSSPVVDTEDKDDDSLLEVLETLQQKHKDLKNEVAEKTRHLENATQTIHAQDRTLAEHAHRMAAERKTTDEHRFKEAGFETCIADLRSNIHQAETDVAIWRTRYEDSVTRTDKKRKLTDDTYTELVSLTSEVNFLRKRHRDDDARILELVKDNHVSSQKIQALHIKLALEIGK